MACRIHLCLLLTTSIWHTLSAKPTANGPMNVLFITSDDMRPDLGCYEDAKRHFMHTPNLDGLAAKSLLLRRAYVQEAVCNPSRASFLTGRRPDTTRVYDLHSYFRNKTTAITIPEHFKNNGYTTASFGKVFHPGVSNNFDDPPSWTEPPYHARTDDIYYYDLIMNPNGTVSWLMVPDSLRTKLPLPDDFIAESAIDFLGNLTTDRPFFVAVGFEKPHMPFVFPADFIKYYPAEKVDLPENLYAPIGMPDIAWSNYCTDTIMCDFTDIRNSNATGEINTTIDFSVIRNLRRAYFSSISYVDSLVGKILKRLEELGLSDNTIVSFVGDHGFHLGEQGEWCKKTNFELANHVPMMVRVPGKTDNGIITNKLTEAVDLFPTLSEAAGLPIPNLCPELNSSLVEFCREGNSLMPLMEDPDTPWKTAAFSQYPRYAPDGEQVMGYTMKTDQYRYTEWVRFIGDPIFEPDWSIVYGIELYDHFLDPAENINRANLTSHHEIQPVLSQLLHNDWRNVPIE